VLKHFAHGDELCSIYELALETPVGSGSVLADWVTTRDGVVGGRAARLRHGGVSGVDAGRVIRAAPSSVGGMTPPRERRETKGVVPAGRQARGLS
jgi:hypothetical protein